MLTIGKGAFYRCQAIRLQSLLFIIVLCWQTRCKAQKKDFMLSYGHGNFLGREHNCDANRLYH